MPAFLEDISEFYGTVERNKAGQTLEEFLKIEKLKKIIYFVKVDKVCKYEM